LPDDLEEDHLVGEAPGGRLPRWSFAFDLFYSDLGKDVTVENTSVSVPEDLQLDMSMTIVEGDVGYQVANAFDFLAGIRRVSASAGLVTEEGRITEVDGGFTDPIVGARFRRYLSEKFWVNVRGLRRGLRLQLVRECGQWHSRVEAHLARFRLPHLGLRLRERRRFEEARSRPRELRRRTDVSFLRGG